MPQLIVHVNTKAVNAAGDETRMRCEVDIWDQLTATIRNALISLLTRIPQAVEASYGEGSIVEGMNLVPDPVPESPLPL